MMGRVGEGGAGNGAHRQSRPGTRKRWSAIERELRAATGPLIAGIDEVGRGPLAGPVVACAIIMPPDRRAIAGVDDSKRLPASDRVRLAVSIRSRALAIGLGAASVREIERLNIYHATTLAMRRALHRLQMRPDHVLLDGRSIAALDTAHTAVVGGDARCYSIACASIVAKVTRDRLMHALAARYPGYAWERNVGYATRDHLDGLGERGLTVHHRRTFFRVKQLLLDLDPPSSDSRASAALARGPGPCIEILVPGEAQA
ncbi:MAG: ribonuclease HII [Gemmatimonadaceae bacterium]